MHEESITFNSGDLTLEGLLAKPERQAARGGVVCHPHPLYGGSMYNNVVDAVLAAMWDLDWATLRFNFRGVGASEGEHSGGSGEAADAVAALNFLTDQSGVEKAGAVLAGYSFGAMAALAAAPVLEGLGALVLIALPLQMVDTSLLARVKCPIVMFAGDRDGYCPARQLEALNRELGARSQVQIIAGADHFFGGYERQIVEALTSMLRAVTNPN